MATVGSQNARNAQAAADPQGYYRLLGVSPKATAEEIKLAFRDRAKRLHPDQGKGDTDAFRELLQAYEILRDERRRQAYDQVAKTEQQRAFHRQKAQTRKSRKWYWRPPKFLMRSPATYLAGALAVLLAVAIVYWRDAAQSLQQHKLVMAQLYTHLEQARADHAEAQTRYRAATFGGLYRLLDHDAGTALSRASETLFNAEITFPVDSTEITDQVRNEANRAVTGLADAIGQIPEDRDWLILVDGYSGKAAESSGVAVADWEESLLRIGTIVGYMVANGMPTERLAVRFQAGFGGFANTDLDTRVVELKLLCCIATDGATNPASN